MAVVIARRTDSDHDAVMRTACCSWIVVLSTFVACYGGEPTNAPSPALSTTAGLTQAPPKDAGPWIQFAEPEFDFGTVICGKVIKHDFIFTNVGSELLEIKDVKSTCGCTSAGAGSQKVDPGETGKIPIEFLTVHFSGPVTKTITLTINNPRQPPVLLQIKGTVWRPIDVVPPTAAFTGTLTSLSNAFVVVKILNQETNPLQLSPPESNHRAVMAELTTNQPGKEYQLKVRLVPPLGLGNVFAQIKMKTSSTNMPEVTVPAWVVAQPAVTVIPTSITLPAGPLSQQQTQFVSIRSLWSDPISLSAPLLNAKGCGLELTELQPGRYFTATLVFPKGFTLPQGEKVEFSVRTSHPQYPLIRVPVVTGSKPASPPSPP
jgi:hypothetical protein